MQSFVCLLNCYRNSFAAKRCGEIMDNPSDVGDDQISSPTGGQSPENIKPGGEPFVSTADEETIDISFVNDDYDSAEVTEITISSPDGTDSGVKEVQIWYKPVGSNTFVPYTPSGSGATVPDTLTVTDDTPIVITGIDVELTDIRIVIIKDESATEMSFDVKVHACLHPGKNTI